ncbi:MAG: hypothetical protein ACYTEQ_05220 [Planctomycetota bacterium]|jgi:hypothetical protein
MLTQSPVKAVLKHSVTIFGENVLPTGTVLDILGKVNECGLPVSQIFPARTSYWQVSISKDDCDFVYAKAWQLTKPGDSVYLNLRDPPGVGMHLRIHGGGYKYCKHGTKFTHWSLSEDTLMCIDNDGIMLLLWDRNATMVPPVDSLLTEEVRREHGGYLEGDILEAVQGFSVAPLYDKGTTLSYEKGSRFTVVKCQGDGWYECKDGSNTRVSINLIWVLRIKPRVLPIRTITAEEKAAAAEAARAVTPAEIALQRLCRDLRTELVEQKALIEQAKARANRTEIRASQLADECGALRTALDKNERSLLGLRGFLSMTPSGIRFLEAFDRRR